MILIFAPAGRLRSAPVAAYAEHRPDYPGYGIEWALPGDRTPCRVLDLGAGTGR